MLEHTARHVDFCETGSSTENGISQDYKALYHGFE